MTKMFASIVCFRSVPGFKKSPVLGSPRFVAYTIVMSALLFGVAMHQVQAQDTIFDWAMDREGDPKGMVEVRPSTLNLTEGNSLRYEIRLSKQPLANGWWVRIHVDGVVYIDGRLEEKGIRWVPSVGWQFNREAGKEDSDPTRWRGVTISAIQDDDSERESVRITHELWDENTNCPPSLHGVAPVTVGVTDDDVPGIKVSPAQLTVPEGGMRTYTVKLNTRPSADVDVSISVPSGADVEVDKPTLTFTRENWDGPQTVKVTAGQDDDAEDDKVVLNHRGSGGGYNGVQGDSLEVTVDDDEVRGATVSKQSLTVPEEESETYTVVLHSQPTARVTVAITVDPSGSDVRVSPTGGLRFTTSDWNVAKTVTVRAVHDNDSVDDTGIKLMHGFNGGDYGGLTVPDVDVTVTDNDDPGISLSTSSLKVREGASKTYRVRLDAEPVADVTVTIEDDGDVDVDPSSLMFTPQNWNSWKTVTVEAEHDPDTGEDPPVTVTHRASGSSSSEYVDETAELTVTIEEDDSPGVTVSRRSLTVREGGKQHLHRGSGQAAVDERDGVRHRTFGGGHRRGPDEP